ncbi:tail fiber protein [Aeromonas phage PX29]|uniref:Probably distal tail fiber protein n=1 Tax=Aeromonas phage PX29 TaxID=926067 RepID=E5DQP7_9CAUD|nr:tail fiber protein [Aeromonas phage PX29]ADQ53033.1 probably distal tail fiber protein [Aeromonas phage PX29]
MITSKGGQTINGTMSLTGDVDTKGRFTAVGNDVAWGSVAQPAFGMDKDNTAGAHWLLASRKRDGSQRAGIQVLTNDSGEMRIYTNKHANYTSFKDGQIYIQATTPSADANATRKDYVDKEINRAMTFAETTTDKLTADLATANTRINTLDAQNVKITGNQNIAGTKTFTDLPVIQDQPTADTHATNKKYVDTKVGTAVQSIGTTAPLTTTGGVNPTLAINQATRTAAGSMSAQDKVKLDDLPADALSRSGGNMKNNAYIKIEGTGGINSLYNSKEYSIFRDHNNGNVTLGAAGGDLYVGYNTTSEEYTTKNVLLYAPMKWNNTNRVLVDTDGFIPWASIKDRVGMEGMSMMLKGPIDFDNYNLTGDYNLYLARATGSNNPPPFDYGTMSVVGSAVIANAFVTQTATDQRTGISYTRTRNDDTMSWTDWNKQYSEKSKPTPAEVGAVNLVGDTMTGSLNAPDFIQTTAQSTNVASCTRKDYVDAQVAPKLNKSGDTMTGALTIKHSYPSINFIESDAVGGEKAFILVADGGGIRLQEDSSRYVWHYSKTQDSIQLYKPEVTAEGMGTKATSLATKAYVDTNAIPVNYTNGTPIAAYFLDGAQSTVGTKIKLPFKADSARMVVFTVRVYQYYEHFDVKFSGYLYPTTNNWYSAKATIISGSTTIVAKMGKDADGTAYVWLSGGFYRGVAVIDVVGGYNTADWNTGWVISMSDDAPNVVFDETLYPPLSLAGGTLVGNLTARDAVVSLSTSGKKWLSIEAMDKNEPYIAYRASGMDQTVQAIVFNKNEFWSTNRLAANKVRIQDDGGLQFSVDSALNGRSYGIGMNASTGDLGIHQYQNGKWERMPLLIANTGDVVFSGKLTSGASGATNALETVGGYIRSNTADIMSMYGNKYAFVASPMDAHLCQNAYWDGSWKKYNVALKSAYAVCREGEFLVKTSNATSVDPNELIPLRLSFDGNLTIAKSINAGGAILGTTLSSTNLGNPLMELHRPGTHASMIWLNGVNGELNVAKSNGAGGETRRMATWEPTTSHLRNYGGISIPTFSCSWGTYSPSGGINPLNDEARITTGEWHPLLTSPRYIHNTQGYVSRWSIGHFRDSDNRNGSFVINMTGDGNLRNNQRFHFTDLGQLTAAGTHDGGYWTAHANGFDCSRLGGNIIDWVLGNFASKGNVVEWQGIGSYAFLGRFDQGGAVGAGGVLPGSSLWYTQAEGTANSGHPPGSWRCCGYTKGERDYGSWNCTVWQRIA